MTRYARRDARPRVTLAVVLPPALIAQLDARAKERGLSRSALLASDLERWYALLESAQGIEGRISAEERESIRLLGERAFDAESLRRFARWERMALLDAIEANETRSRE